jgi:hypothetical protein
MTLNYMSSVWVAAFLVGGSLVAWNPRSGPPLRAAGAARSHRAGRFRRRGADAASDHRPAAGVRRLVGLLSGLLSAFAYLQVMALGRIGEPEVRTVFYFAVAPRVAGAAGMLLEGMSPLAVAARAGGCCRWRRWPRWASGA